MAEGSEAIIRQNGNFNKAENARRGQLCENDSRW
jgi:hypothetical protein